MANFTAEGEAIIREKILKRIAISEIQDSILA
jgi:hypothetical protein